MIKRFTVITTPVEPEVDALSAVARAEMFKKMAPLFGEKREVLANAFKKLERDLEGAEDLERLIGLVGNEVLSVLPKSVLPSVYRDLFLETEGGEDGLMSDDEAFDIDMDNADDMDEHIHAKESLRFPKFVLFFWNLAKREGVENAKVLLETTLATMASYELLYFAKTLDPEVVAGSELVSALPSFYANLLRSDGEAPVLPRAEVTGLREYMAGKMVKQLEGVDENLVLRSVRENRMKLEKAVDGSIAESRKLHGFSRELLKFSTLEAMSDAILAAAPKPKQK